MLSQLVMLLKALNLTREDTMNQNLVFDKWQTFIAMFIGWFAGYIYFAIHMVHFSGWGYVTDFSAIFFWTGIFALISAFTFVPMLIRIYNKTLVAKQKLFFPLAAVLASQIALAVLLLPFTNFRPFELGGFYFGYAGIVGFVFGLFYVLFQINPLFNDDSQLTKKMAFFVSPVLFLFFLFYLFPYANPTLAYKYFGDSIKEKAMLYVVSKFKVGDKIKDLHNQLPKDTRDVFVDSVAIFGMESGSGYSIKYEKGVITELVIDNKN